LEDIGHNHHDNQLKTFVRVAEGVAQHLILRGIRGDEFRVFSSPYKSLPLAQQAAALMFGCAENIESHAPSKRVKFRVVLMCGVQIPV